MPGDNIETIRLALHSFSFEQHFLHKPGFDAHAFLARASELGVSGVHISLNGHNFRCAGGTSPSRLAEIAADAHNRGLFVECDPSGTDPDHLVELAHAARQLGADKLRTYTRHKGDPETVYAATVADLKRAASPAADLGITLLLENHEDFTGAEVARILDEVAHPSVAALFDFGNSMNVAEEPLEAARAMARHTRSVHLKDHLMVRGNDGEPLIAGVANGTGNVDIATILALLIDEADLQRICIESSFGYCSRILRFHERLKSAPGTTFEIMEPPYDQADVLLDPDALRRRDPPVLFNLEQAATTRGVAHARQVLGELGFVPVLNARGAVYRRGGDTLAFADRHF